MDPTRGISHLVSNFHFHRELSFPHFCVARNRWLSELVSQNYLYRSDIEASINADSDPHESSENNMAFSCGLARQLTSPLLLALTFYRLVWLWIRRNLLGHSHCLYHWVPRKFRISLLSSFDKLRHSAAIFKIRLLGVEAILGHRTAHNDELVRWMVGLWSHEYRCILLRGWESGCVGCSLQHLVFFVFHFFRIGKHSNKSGGKLSGLRGRQAGEELLHLRNNISLYCCLHSVKPLLLFQRLNIRVIRSRLLNISSLQ